MKSMVTYKYHTFKNDDIIETTQMNAIETKYSPKTTIKGWNEMMTLLEDSIIPKALIGTIIILNIWELKE